MARNQTAVNRPNVSIDRSFIPRITDQALLHAFKRCVGEAFGIGKGLRGRADLDVAVEQ